MAGDAPVAVPVSVNTTYMPESAAEKEAYAVRPVPDSLLIAPLELYHCHENDPVPPVTMAEIVMD